MCDQPSTHATTEQHANQLFTPKSLSTAVSEQSQDLTSASPLDSYINTRSTDEEILTGDPKLITQERILQVSATHTAEEISSKVNTGQHPQALTPKLVYHRIHTACHSVATKNNTSFEMVKLALNNARIESGVKARINATLGRAVSVEPSIGGVGEAQNGSDTSNLTEIDDASTTYLGDFFSTPSTLRASNPLFKRLAKGGSKLPENEDLIRLASKHTVMEIVQMVQDADPMTSISNTKVSARIMDALSLFAIARSLPREVVKKEFEIAKQANGVVARHYEKISTKRKATTLARKADLRQDSATMFVSPKSEKQDSSELNEEDSMEIQEPPTPSSDAEDAWMKNWDGNTEASWIDSPRFDKYKNAPTTSESDLDIADSEMMEEDSTKECLSQEQAAMILLEMRWLNEPDLSEEGAALVLLKIRAEAQDVTMGMPSDLND